MATTTAHMNTQLTTDKQAQTGTATPTVKTKEELAGLLASTIHYHRHDLFDARLEAGADINYYGPDDRNKYMKLPLINAILYDNTRAFDELVRRKADVNKVQIDPTTGERSLPLFAAVQFGNEDMVRKLLDNGANPLGYCKGTSLTLLLEMIQTRALLESRWRYENESANTDNTVLKQQISAFFYQTGRYEPSKPSAVVSLDAPEDVIHVHYEGKLEILEMMLDRGVRPDTPVSGTHRSALAIVQNPTAYSRIFRSGDDEVLEYKGTEAGKPNILLFEMTLVNKRNTGTFPARIVVHYDFEPSRRAIEFAMKRHNPHLLELTQKTADLAEAVKKVRDVGRFDEKDEVERFKLFIKDHPNAEEAYNTILSRLKSIHKSAQAVAGGGVVVSEGSLALVATVLNVSEKLVNSIPLVGGLASQFFGLAASATKQVDSVRQTNIYENIAAMVPATGAGRIFESVARKLTMAYLPVFQRLQTREEAEAQVGRPTALVQDALKGRFISPAERVAAFAMIWMIDDVFNNMHKREIAKALKEPNGLETLLLNVVTQRKPEQGVETFWNTIIVKLGMNQIPTRTPSGAISVETWHPADFWTRPGVKVEDSQNSGAVQCFAGNNTNAAKFGFRFGSMADVEALGLAPTTEAAALLPQASSQTTTPTPSANSRPTAPVPPPSPRMMYAYATTSSSTPRKPEPCETKVASDVPTPPSAPKRSKSPSPFAGFKLLGSRRGCPTPLTTT